MTRMRGGFTWIFLVFIRDDPPHPRHLRSINTYTGVKKAPGLRLCPLTLLLNPTIFKPLRFGELAGGVLPAPALLIGAGELKPQVRVVRVLPDGRLQRRHGFGGLALLEQDFAEQGAGVGGTRWKRERELRSFARRVELAFGVVQKREVIERPVIARHSFQLMLEGSKGFLITSRAEVRDAERKMEARQVV